MKTILIAEDTDSNYLLLSIILRKKFQLVRALNGKEAIDLFLKERPELILMDLKMPVMDGLEATRTIRRMDANIPIIALTANAFDSDRQKSIEAGCSDYMSKPIIASELIMMVGKYL